MTSGHFWIGLLDFFLLGCMSCLYILDINPLSVISFANVVSHSVGCLYEEIFKCIIIYLIAAFLHWASSPTCPAPTWGLGSQGGASGKLTLCVEAACPQSIP